MPTILIADDDHDTRDTLRQVLAENQYDFLETSNGIETLEVLRSHPGRLLVLLDLHMPKNGIRVLDEIASHPDLAQKHDYLLLSASPQHAAHPTVVTLGLTYIAKPFDVDAFLHAVVQASPQAEGTAE